MTPGPAGSDLTLIGASYSVYSRIVRICLAEKGIAYRFREIDIFDEIAKHNHLKYHPFGKIPVLLTGDATILETGAIVRYLDAAFEDAPLFATEALEVALEQQAIEIVNAYAYPCLVWKVYVPWSRAREREAGQPDFSDEAAQVEICLTALDMLIGGRDWFSGARFGAADAFVYPVLVYFCKVPWAKTQLEKFTVLKAWFKRAGRRPCVRTTKFPEESGRP